MKIIYKYFILLLLPASLLLGCGEDFEDKLTGQLPESNIVYVEDRITGFEQEVTAPGATVTAVGNNLSSVKRVLVGADLVPALNVEATESSVTFRMPDNTSLGEQELVFVFAGIERQRVSIEVVPVSTVTYTSNLAGGEGDEIVFYGSYLDRIETISVGEVDAPIDNQTANSLSVNVPAGASSGSIVLTGETGTIEIEGFISCGTEDEADSWACAEAINPNMGFEDGTPGVIESGGDHGGGWFMQGDNTPTTYSIVDAATVPGRGGRGDFTLQANVTGPVTENPWDAQAVNTPGDIPGGAYMLSAWVQGPEGTQVNVGAGLNGAPYTNYAYAEVPMTGEWVHVTYMFQTVDPTGNGTNIAFHFSLPGNAGSVFHVDDLKIIPAGDWIDPVANPDQYCERYSANGGNIPDAPDCE